MELTLLEKVVILKKRVVVLENTLAQMVGLTQLKKHKQETFIKILKLYYLKSQTIFQEILKKIKKSR